MVGGLVSIIVPAFNHEIYIASLLDSICEQTYSQIEVIVCDDCSNDNTYKVALGYCDKIEKSKKSIAVLKNDVNLGVCKTLNRMLSICNGEYIKVIASDDFLLPDAIEEYVTMFCDKAYLGVAVANAYLVEVNAKYPLSNPRTLPVFYAEQPDFNSEGLFNRLIQDNYICAPSMMYRRNVFEKIGFYDENITFEDWDMNLRIAQAGIQIAYIDKCLVAYRQVATSQTHGVSEKSYLRHFGGLINTLDKHTKEHNQMEVKQAKKNICYHYLTCAKKGRYRLLKQEVIGVMRQSSICLAGWCYLEIKIGVAKLLKRRGFRK